VQWSLGNPDPDNPDPDNPDPDNSDPDNPDPRVWADYSPVFPIEVIISHY
jgi:hypothetical protein